MKRRFFSARVYQKVYPDSFSARGGEVFRLEIGVRRVSGNAGVSEPLNSTLRCWTKTRNKKHWRLRCLTNGNTGNRKQVST